ncbi:uncharacterized protein LOC122009157 isoform X1 [Zingiber officinale]|uniref:uncharacterized protein LOC122009157 isoform X1 n=2 Tax=Zingiber officinale TaxID=94328 RepID=UPI001C4C972D|nr:uncharacterized protein LOC122009157 isoform X1 [Zingiber officinale]
MTESIHAVPGAVLHRLISRRSIKIHHWNPLPPSPIRSPPPATLSLRRPGASLRRDFSSLMASPAPSLAPGSPFELNDESDFDSIITPDGFLSVLGFGSLLSERSARSTFPDLKNFRIAVLRGFRRVFAHVAPIFFERGIANEATGEVSSLSVEPCEGEFLIVTVFEIKKEGVPAFIERENEFRFLAVYPEYLDGISFTNPAVVCARYSDEEYFHIRCKGNKGTFFNQYGRYNIQKIWRDDILPCRVYLRHCVLAAKNLGELAYDNFLDHTFISDRKTSIGEYLNSTGSGIMEEEPPEVLKYRYGG